MPHVNSQQDMRRLGYRPPCIRTLFIGESPPANGTFFYYGDSNLARSTCEALGGLADPDGRTLEFLRQFREWGFYLYDLCQEPVNRLPRDERRTARLAGEQRLASRIAQDRPDALVVVMKAIVPHVLSASRVARYDGPIYHLPFPALGHQRKYVEALSAISACLPREHGAYERPCLACGPGDSTQETVGAAE